MSTSTSPVGAYSIVANTLSAGAIAVGENACATSHSTAMAPEKLDALKDAITRLESAIGGLQLSPDAIELLRDQTRTMKKLTERGDVAPSGIGLALKALKDKLTMAGIVIADVAALASPARAIAQSANIALDAVGL